MIDRTIARGGLAALAAVAILGGAASGLIEEDQDGNTRRERVERPALTDSNAVRERPTAPRVNDPASAAITLAGTPVVDCACDAQYSVGDRVYATVDNPASASTVFFGDRGTVVSGNLSDLGGRILIAWDGYANGHGGNGFTECPEDETDDTNRWWVSCDEIALVALDCGCGAENGWTLGERVLATTDITGGIPFGSVGTIVSGKSSEPLSVLVAWDTFDGGHGGNGLTQCPPAETEDTNRWWVDCDNIEPLAGNGTIDCACDSQFDAGDIVVCVIGGFEGGTYGLGRRGRVITGVSNRGVGDIMLVQWDGWFGGHDGIPGTYANNSCPTFVGEGESRWWVPCDHIARLVGCTADINGDGEVNGADLTIVLGAWGSCP